MKHRQANLGYTGMAKWPLWAQLIAMLGFPIFVALWLMGMWSGYIHSPITTLAAQMNQHVMGEEQRVRIMRVMCYHQAVALRLNAEECN